MKKQKPKYTNKIFNSRLVLWGWNLVASMIIIFHMNLYWIIQVDVEIYFSFLKSLLTLIQRSKNLSRMLF